MAKTRYIKILNRFLQATIYKQDEFIDKALIENFLIEYLKYAHGIVSEYLAEDLSKKLAQRLNISDEVESKKRKITSPQNEMTDEKKLKRASLEESPVSTAKKQTKNLSKPEKVSYQ